MPTPKPNPKPSLGIDRRHRALALLAGSPDGMTESLLLAHGFPIAMMAELVGDGLVTARPEWMRVGSRGQPRKAMSAIGGKPENICSV
jgi:hypothetical protein